MVSCNGQGENIHYHNTMDNGLGKNIVLMAKLLREKFQLPS